MSCVAGVSENRNIFTLINYYFYFTVSFWLYDFNYFQRSRHLTFRGLFLVTCTTMSKQAEVVTLKSYPHHNMWKYCENRPKYRQGRKLTAVKVLRRMTDLEKCILELNIVKSTKNFSYPHTYNMFLLIYDLYSF